MIDNLKKWIEDNRARLENEGVVIDNISLTNQSITIDHSSSSNLGRISL